MSPRQRHHIRQARPNRRFRRLVPAAAVAAALAGMPAVAPAATHHSSQAPTARVRPAGPQKATVARTDRDAAGGSAVSSA
jgi:hypothetical protein